MSYQRAVVNCRRCYERSREITTREGITRDRWLSSDADLLTLREREQC